MRDDEFAWEPYGAAMAFELEAALDASGAIVSWRHEFWSNGHTHRPGRHEYRVAGRDRVRWVLPDWYRRGGYLEASPAGIRAVGEF